MMAVHQKATIYHAHGSNPWELAEGVFGALMVLNPGETYDRGHEVPFVIGAGNPGFGPKPVTINGSNTLARNARFSRLSEIVLRSPSCFTGNWNLESGIESSGG